MKKILFPLLGIVLAFSFTGKKDLPSNIAAGITAKYPDARIKGWEMVNHRYKVKINANGNKEITYFSTNGNWLRTEKHLALTKDLPAEVRDGFKKSGYADWRVIKINEVTSPDQPKRYVLHVDDSNQLDSWHNDAFKKEFLLYFDREGKLLERKKA